MNRNGDGDDLDGHEHEFFICRTDPSTGTYVSREKAALILSTIGITNTIGS